MINEKAVISYKRFNPNFHHLKEALKDDDLRFIFLKGGSSSAKSFSIAQCFLLMCLTNGYNTKVYRKTGASIADSIYKTFIEASKSLGLYQLFSFKENKIVCLNGSYITFSGLDDPEKIKGLESYQYVFCEELNEFDHSDFKQIKKRLRGRKGQKIVSAFNPVSEDCWIKKDVFDKEEFHEVRNDLFGKLRDPNTGKVLSAEYSHITKKLLNSQRYVFNPRKEKEEIHNPDTLILQSTYLDNYWVVGSPCGTYGFYDRQTVADFEKDKIADYNQYRIYALGEWGSIKTGGEFLGSFDPGKHKGAFVYNQEYPIHVSIDNNVLPYISISIWQYYEKNGSKHLRQVHEICAEDPFNTATKSSEMLRLWLDGIGYKDVVYLYGDASTRNGNTIDENKRSFLDIFIDGLDGYVINDRIPASNPPVAISGEFINAIFSESMQGLSIGIGEQCKCSIHDYENVKKDVNGAILKKKIKNKATGQSYEEFGHLTDTFRYVCVSVFKDEFTKFSLRRKRNSNQEDDMKYYNVDLETKIEARIAYVMPLVNDMTVLVCGDVHEYVDISSVFFRSPIGRDELISILKKLNVDLAIFECDKSHFQLVREIRETLDGIDIRISSLYANKLERISANEDFIKKMFRFRSDYDLCFDYVNFMDNVMDYNGKDNYEAINNLSGLSMYIQRNYFSN